MREKPERLVLLSFGGGKDQGWKVSKVKNFRDIFRQNFCDKHQSGKYQQFCCRGFSVVTFTYFRPRHEKYGL